MLVVNQTEPSSSRRNQEVTSLNELFHQSKELRTTKKFLQFMDFVKKFRRYSLFNNALVYLQNPNVTFYATRVHWWKKFKRRVKSDARAMIILAPMSPVLAVYDLEDTEGGRLPEYIIDPFKTEGHLPPASLDLTIENCKRDGIDVERVPHSFLRGGRAVHYFFRRQNAVGHNGVKIRIEINDKLDNNATYAVLCHEIAHVYLGHLGDDKDRWWPDRRFLSKSQVELEAEATSFLVCSRAGLEKRSAEYLSCYLRDEKDLQVISIDWIIKTAGLIERMGTEKLPKRKKGNEATGSED